MKSSLLHKLRTNAFIKFTVRSRLTLLSRHIPPLELLSVWACGKREARQQSADGDFRHSRASSDEDVPPYEDVLNLEVNSENRKLNLLKPITVY